MINLRHKLLRISSEDRNFANSPSTSDFVTTFGNMDGLQNAKSVIVKQISFPNIFHNINATNRILTYNIGGTPSTIQIPIGQYDVTEFITALENAGTGIGLDLTLNTTNNRMLLATTTAVQWLDIKQGNAMAEVLGITVGGGSTGDVNAFTPIGVISLGGPHNVYVESNTLGETNLVGSDEKTINILAVVPITVPYGGVEHYISSHSEIDDVDSTSLRHGKNIQKIDIRLLDKYGEVMDLLGQHITIVLKIFY